MYIFYIYIKYVYFITTTTTTTEILIKIITSFHIYILDYIIIINLK